MKKYAAITKTGKRLISVFAEDKKDAERQIAIHLRGRPGRSNFYERWVVDGKLIVES